MAETARKRQESKVANAENVNNVEYLKIQEKELREKEKDLRRQLDDNAKAKPNITVK